jgi:hypothetical protein
MALARLSLLKSQALLNESVTKYDQAFAALLVSASLVAHRFTARKLESGSYQEYYTGKNALKLYLNEYPVLAVNEVKLWDGVDSYDVENAAYYQLIDKRYLQYPRLGQESTATWSYWKACYLNGIWVSYIAGYITNNWNSAGLAQDFGVPYDLEYAVAKLAALMWKDGMVGGPRLGVTTLAVGGESMGVEKYLTSLPHDIQMVFTHHRRIDI